MTARFSETDDRLSLAQAPVPSTGFTFAAWARLTADANGFGTLLRLYDASTTLTMAVGSDGVTLGCYSVSGSNPSVGAMAVNVWYRVAITITGTACLLYMAEGQNGAVAVQSGTVAGGSAIPTGLALGGRAPGDPTEPWPGDVAYARVWDRVLSQAELEDQWRRSTPTAASIWASWPLTADLTDEVGSRDLTPGATPVEFLSGDEPPLGGNTAPSITALALTSAGANATAVITASDADTLAGATYTVDWGDGATSSGSSATLTHTYAASGTYAVLASVTDAGSLSGYKAGAIRVSVPAVSTTSVLGVAKDALVAALDTDTLSGRVHYAWPGPQVAKEWFEGLWLGDVKDWTQQFPNSRAGRKQRQEEFTIQAVIWVAKPDQDSTGAKATQDRALELLAVVENALADDVQVGSAAIQWGQVASMANEMTPLENGWGCMITVDITAHARLT